MGHSSSKKSNTVVSPDASSQGDASSPKSAAVDSPGPAFQGENYLLEDAVKHTLLRTLPSELRTELFRYVGVEPDMTLKLHMTLPAFPRRFSLEYQVVDGDLYFLQNPLAVMKTNILKGESTVIVSRPNEIIQFCLIKGKAIVLWENSATLSYFSLRAPNALHWKETFTAYKYKTVERLDIFEQVGEKDLFATQASNTFHLWDLKGNKVLSMDGKFTSLFRLDESYAAFDNERCAFTFLDDNPPSFIPVTCYKGKNTQTRNTVPIGTSPSGDLLFFSSWGVEVEIYNLTQGKPLLHLDNFTLCCLGNSYASSMDSPTGNMSVVNLTSGQVTRCQTPPQQARSRFHFKRRIIMAYPPYGALVFSASTGKCSQLIYLPYPEESKIFHPTDSEFVIFEQRTAKETHVLLYG